MGHSIRLLVNGNPATRIKAEITAETEKALQLNCEGDEHWFPKTQCKVEKEGTVLISDWIYAQKFHNG